MAPHVPAGGADSRKTRPVIHPRTGAATGTPNHLATSQRASVLRRWDAHPGGVGRISTFDLSRYMGASLTMIDRHYGHLAKDGREHAISLLDAHTGTTSTP